MIKMKLGVQVGLGPGHIVLDRDSAPPPHKRGGTPNLRHMSVVAKWLHTWYGGRPRPRRLCVWWGPTSPRTKGTALTQFLAHVYCGQTAGWMKTPLGMEVDLGLATLC